MTESKAIQEEAFSQTLVCCMSDVNIVLKRVKTILSDGINKYIYLFLLNFLCPQLGNLIVTMCIQLQTLKKRMHFLFCIFPPESTEYFK